MSTGYHHLALSQVKAGMILSDELLDKQGQVLLPRGAVLTAKTIALLPSHGVESLAVLDEDSGMDHEPSIDPVAVHARMAVIFRKNHADDDLDWATADLRRYMTDFRLGREVEP